MQPQGQATTAPDGTIYTACNVAIGSSTSVNAFNPNGTLKWSVDRFGGISAPDLGPNGNIYFVYQAGHLGALSPAGATLWNVFDGTNNLQYPAANPAGGMVFVGGGQNGNPGFVRAYSSTNGLVLWQLDLGAENVAISGSAPDPDLPRMVKQSTSVRPSPQHLQTAIVISTP
jgi:outer membrane protein assembly factor BamB